MNVEIYGFSSEELVRKHPGCLSNYKSIAYLSNYCIRTYATTPLAR